MPHHRQIDSGRHRGVTRRTGNATSDDIYTVVAHWRAGGISGDFCAQETTNPTPGQTARFPEWIDIPILQAMTSLGITSPWQHQVDAWNSIAAGRATVIATPTASGKSLAYIVPIVARLLSRPSARALLLFPTKALARDQESTIRRFIDLCGADLKTVVYDGDTPGDVRRKARTEAHIIITNPDMLHTGILPHHTAWAQFWAGLTHVVVDEMHTYRGIFGSHVANVVRRLQRVCGFYNARPIFIGCSATIGNPGELGEALFGAPTTLIDKSTAPTGTRTFVLFNPPVVDPVMGIRASAHRIAARMGADLVLAGVTSLIFCQTRRGVEIVLRYLRDKVRQNGGDPGRIRGYRGGYLPLLRREIETALQQGDVDAVVATNALELGIDVGALDAVLLCGYPGTIAATHQRAGRAGRRQSPSLAVLIAGNAPLDQFLAREPAYLLHSTPEVALVQPDNVTILLAHLRCAAFELPFATTDRFGTLGIEDTDAALSCLTAESDLVLRNGRYHYIGSAYPAAQVSLRDVGNPVVVVQQESGEPLAEVAWRAAHFELFDHAIYQHEGETFEVQRFDPAASKAWVSPVPPVYYTTAVAQSRIAPLATHATTDGPGGTIFIGDVSVVENVVGCKKIKFRTHENLGYDEVSLPPLQMETEAVWVQLHEHALRDWPPDITPLALDGLRHALHQVTALRLMADPRDIATLLQGPHLDAPDAIHAETAALDPDATASPTPPPVTLYLYDTHEGGAGLMERAFASISLLFSDAQTLIRGCPCPDGCPACIGPLPVPAHHNLKDIAARIAAHLVVVHGD
jgi:DEAD/DEAH box helicase domain-containing protein